MTVFNQKFPVVLCKSFAVPLKRCCPEIFTEWLMGAQKGISVISPPDFYMLLRTCVKLQYSSHLFIAGEAVSLHSELL